MVPRKTPIIAGGITYWHCSKCKALKEAIDFCKDKHAVNGLHPSCKICHIEGVRKTQRENPEKTRATSIAYNQSDRGKAIHAKWREGNPKKLKAYSDKFRKSERGKETLRKGQANYRINNPEKTYARNLAYLARSNGGLIRQPCEVCGTTDDIHAHHDDYSKPLEVRWLCRKHHNIYHRQMEPNIAVPN